MSVLGCVSAGIETQPVTARSPTVAVMTYTRPDHFTFTVYK